MRAYENKNRMEFIKPQHTEQITQKEGRKKRVWTDHLFLEEQI